MIQQNKIKMFKTLPTHLLLVPLLLLVSVNSVTQSDYNPDVALDSTFAQTQDISKIIVQPEEFVKIYLEDYFRGQLLSYTASYDNESYADVAPSLMTFQQGAMSTANVSKFSGYDSQSSAQIDATIVYRDYLENSYMAFIDQYLNLNIYFLSQYYSSVNATIGLVGFQSIINDNYLSSRDNLCSNLLYINYTTLMVNCLGNGDDALGVFVFMDISDMSSITASYYPNQFKYFDIENGKILYYSYYLDGSDTKDSFFIIKFEKSSPSLDLYYVDQNNEFQYIYTLSNISGSLYNQNLISSVGNLQIEDIVQINNKSVLLIADYVQGLFIVELICNVTTCEQGINKQIFMSHANSLSVFYEEDVSEDNQYSIFVTSVQPPTIYEIFYDLSFTYTQKIYNIEDDDTNFIAFNIIDANQNYIVTQFLSLQEFMPILRIYKRQSNFFQFAHFALEYTKFIDEGTFLQFISDYEDSFVIKTGHLFEIYKILPQELGINATDYTLFNNSMFIDQTITINLMATNYSGSVIYTSFELYFLPENQCEAISTQNSFQNTLIAQTYSYSCGDKAQKFDISTIFSGPKSSLLLNSSEEYEDLFYIDYPNIKYDSIVNISISTCNLNSFLNFSILGQPEIYFACIEQFSNQISFIDVFNETQSVDPQILNFTIPFAEIVAYIADQGAYNFYAFSQQASNQSLSLIMHYFKIYNILAWESKQDLYYKYPELQQMQFKLDPATPIQFNAALQQGSMISDSQVQTEYYLDGVSYSVVVLVFEVTAIQGIEIFSIRGSLQLDFNISSGEDNLFVSNARVDTYGFLWVMLSNNTIIIYQQIKRQCCFNYPNNDYAFFLKYVNNITLDKDKTLSNFYLGTSYILLFLGNNTVQMMEMYNGAPFDINNIMNLPVAFNSSNLFNDEEEDQYNTFFFSSVSNKPIYSASGNYFLVLFSRYFSNGTLQFNFLNIYDVSQTRNNVLITQYMLPTDNFTLNPEYAHMYILNKQGNQIITITSQNQMLVLNASLTTTLRVNASSPSYESLNENCRDSLESIPINLTIMPADVPDQQVALAINAFNNGNLITSEVKEDNMTLMLQYFKENDYQPYDGNYLLNQMVSGFNLSYDIFNCGSFNDEDICSYIEMSPTFDYKEQNIDFLNSYDYLIGFFFIQPAFIMIDISNRITVYFLINNYYYQYSAQSILGMNPNQLINYLPYMDFNGTIQNITYMVYQSQDTRAFSITKIISSNLYNISMLGPNVNTSYTNFNSTIYIKNIDNSCVVSKIITHSNLMNYDVDNLLLVLSYDIPNVQQQSIILFYNVSFNDSPSVDITPLSYSLSANSLDLNSFRVDSIAMFPVSSLLIIGIENYGILLYDMLSFQPIKFISIIKETLYEKFIISSIVANQWGACILVLDKLGVLSIRLTLLKEGAKTSFTNEDQIDYTFKDFFGLNQNNEAAVSGVSCGFSGGFGYLTKLSDDFLGQGEFSDSFNIRYFDYFTSRNTKLIGYTNIPSNYQCQFIQSIPYIYGNTLFSTTSINEDYKIIATVCHSQLYYTAYNYYPTVQIHLESNDSSDGISNLQNFTSIVSINISNSQDTQMLFLYIAAQRDYIQQTGKEYAYFIVLSMMTMFVFFLVYKSAQTKVQEKEKRQEIRKTTLKDDMSFDRSSSNLGMGMVSYIERKDSNRKSTKGAQYLTFGNEEDDEDNHDD